ncbi:ImpA family type VI secretion system protein, partial [Pelomonas sp. KK5]|uniref:type VI secretion system protein TssA n=1 Tax=Pelomonas sp. KK5 TaxID=1855730 RepID=UPI00097C3B20
MFKLPQFFGSRGQPQDERLRALSDAQPCGPWLEVDADYAVFQALLRPRAEVQFGSFVQQAAGPDWLAVESGALALLNRSRDISLLVAYTRARLARAGAPGLRDGLQWLLDLMRAWPAQLHPQLLIDGEPDPALRANAIGELADADGLLSQLRQLPISGGSGTRLLVRDVERAFARSRAADALPADAVRHQLHELRAQRSETLMALIEAAALVRAIRDWSREQLAAEAPEFGSLLQALESLDITGPAPLASLLPGPARKQEARVPMNTGSLGEDRERIRQNLRQARQWIEQHEPSSPVAVLLKQAERLWGRRFSEVAHV